MEDEFDFETLSLSPLLVGLNQDELRTLVLAADTRHYKNGEVVVEEGTAGESMYLLHDGEVVIWKRAADGENVELTRLHKCGDFFGEMVFVDVLPRSATVSANPEAHLLIFPLETLREFFENHRDAHLSIVLNMTRVLSKRLRAANEQIVDLKSSR